MTNLDIARRRLHNQLITQPATGGPAEVVRRLGAVQAQEYADSLWAIGLRLPQAREADIEQAIAAKTIVRTWPMRGTIHFVAAEDIRWIHALMAPHVRKLIANIVNYHRLNLDEAAFERSSAVIAEALRGSKQLTRPELKDALERAGLDVKGIAGMLMLQRAEGEGLICQAVKRGKQHTFALLDEWLPPETTKRLTREEALAEFTRRYFTSHGPATLQDYMWWSGLPATEARAGLEMVQSQLVQEVSEGRTYWLPSMTAATEATSPVAFLLPPYDEYSVAYRDRSAVINPAYTGPTGKALTASEILGPTIVIDGEVVGTWKREIKKESVVITLKPLLALNAAQSEALAVAIERYSQFIDRPIIML